MNEPINAVVGRAIHLPDENIDTDQIIPARFLTTSTRDGMGELAFADYRQRPNSPLADPNARGCSIIVGGHNFGCGSSREHAAWALAGMGIRAVLSTALADIFTSNCLKNGIVPATITPDAYDAIAEADWPELEVDVASLEVRMAGEVLCSFPLPPFDRRCLLEGVDHLGYLLAQDQAISAYESARA